MVEKDNLGDNKELCSEPTPLSMNTSYKSMLRDRCPKVVDIALRWCRAKTKWINHVYSHFINIYVMKEDRYDATRIVLGISSKYRNFEFERTIDWENISESETEYWKTISEWVKWFQSRHIYIETDITEGLSNEKIAQKYKELSSMEDSESLVEYIRRNL